MLQSLRRLFRREPTETAAERAEWIGRTVRSVAAPLQSQMLAQLAQSGRRSFEAAETPAWVASWPTTVGAINEDLERQLPTLRDRSRNLARNNEWAARWLLQLEDNLLGAQGVRLQVRLPLVTRPDTQDTAANAALESAWDRFCARGACEVSGLMSWREVEAQAIASLARDGELLYRLRPGVGPFGFAIQMLPATLLDVGLNREHQGRRIRMGIEIDDDGRRVAYWLLAAKAGDAPGVGSLTGRHVRIPAAEIRHCYLADEIGQLRGIPWLAVGARRLWMAHQFEEAAAVASTNSAQRLGFFVSPSGDAPPGFADQIISSVLDAARAAGKVLSPEEIQQLTDAAEKHATTMPGTFDTLPQGYDFRQWESPWPNIEAAEYVKSQIRGWSGARGASYVTVGNDLEAVNYSSARVGILDEREHYKVLQGKLIGWLHQEVFAAWLPYAVLATPGLRATRLADYLRFSTWRPRRWAGIDPVKEAAAAETELRLGLTSRSRLILERGEDPEQIAAERAEDDRLFGPLPDAAAASQPMSGDDEPPAKAPARGQMVAVVGA